MTKVGRNEKCPCGSGRKYKSCCLRDRQTEGGDRYDEIRAVESKLLKELYRHGAEVLGEGTKAAWDEWTLWAKSPLPMVKDQEPNELMIFAPWSLFCWRPRALQNVGDTVAGSYLTRRRDRLTDDERILLQAVAGQPLSFWDVIDVQPGFGFRVRDIFREIELEVRERSASRQIEANDIMFGLFGDFNGMGLIMGMAPFSIPPREKQSIIEMRRKLKKKYGEMLTSEHLNAEQEAFRELFFAIRERLFNPPMPKLCNTDGDPLVPHKIRYKINEPNDAFCALKPLMSKVADEDAIMENTEKDTDGRVKKATLRWLREETKHGFGDGTTLAILYINDKTMTVEVNSEKRAQKIKKEIRKLLPSAAHVATVIEPIDQELEKSWRDRSETKNTKPSQPNLDEIPEVQAAMKKAMDEHWRRWPDEKLPALDGKTPRQAVRNVDGREMVEALLADFERRNEHVKPMLKVDIEALRRTLGLAEKSR